MLKVEMLQYSISLMGRGRGPLFFACNHLMLVYHPTKYGANWIIRSCVIHGNAVSREPEEIRRF